VRSARRRQRRTSAVGALLALTLLGSAIAVGATRSPALASSASHAPSHRALVPRTLSPGDHWISLTVGGIARGLILHVPPNPAVPNRPLLLIYHGLTDTAESTEQGTDFSQVADQTGEVVAFLQGYDDSWDSQTGWTPAALAHINDIAYTTAVIAKLKGVVPFDHQRVVAVGFSNGALMVEDLGCKIARQLEYVVPVEGELGATMSASCRPARPISVYEIHGTADTSISYNGGPILGHETVVLSAPKSVARWAHLDRCARTPTTTYTSTTIKLTTYSKCANHASVTLRTIIGGVHQWEWDIGAVVASLTPS
jgi:polyhydroxybutyrate depolymerase